MRNRQRREGAVWVTALMSNEVLFKNALECLDGTSLHELVASLTFTRRAEVAISPVREGYEIVVLGDPSADGPLSSTLSILVRGDRMIEATQVAYAALAACDSSTTIYTLSETRKEFSRPC